MIPPEVKDRIRKLSAAGHSIRRIARSLKLSRQSVRKVLRDDGAKPGPALPGGDPPSSDPAKARPSILDPFKSDIERILKEHEELKKKIPETKDLTTRTIFKEVRRRGYTGGHTILDDYLRSIRGSRRRRARTAHARFETLVAEESQQDWSPYRVMIGGEMKKIHVFSITLAWSRYQFLMAFMDERLDSLLYGHVAAFKYFAGVPWKIMYDRQACITPGDVDGVPIINDKFQGFVDHYGFAVEICAPGHKERKGKIERIFLYFETGFLPRRTFESVEDFNTQLRAWLDGLDEPDEGNLRVHGTTQEVPYERWLEERQYLLELPRTDHLPRRVETRRVNHDCTISVLNSLYTVPARLVEKGTREIWVSIGCDDLLVYDKSGNLVAEHKLSEDKGKLVIDESHYEELRRRKTKRPLPELEARFLERFAAAGAFLAGLKRTVRSLAPIHLREILALARRYSREDVNAALARCVADGTTTSGYLRRILEQKHPTGHIGNLDRTVPRGLSLGAVEPGTSNGYQDIFSNEQNQERTDDDGKEDHTGDA